MTPKLVLMEGEMDTPSYKLFNVYYKVRVEAIHLISEHDIRMYGTPSCGVKEFDDAAKHEMRDTILTAISIAYLHERGATLYFVDPKDTVDIYKNIQEHLRTWVEILNTNFVINKPELEDFRLLDNLAAGLFPITQWAGEALPLIGLAGMLAMLQSGNSFGMRSVRKKMIKADGLKSDYTQLGHYSYFGSLVGKYSSYMY